MGQSQILPFWPASNMHYIQPIHGFSAYNMLIILAGYATLEEITEN
jgi:hypothetical protein